MKQYEIWWAELPLPAGGRPVLLLSRNDAYEALNKYIAVEITTTVRDIPVEVFLDRQDRLEFVEGSSGRRSPTSLAR